MTIKREDMDTQLDIARDLVSEFAWERKNGTPEEVTRLADRLADTLELFIDHLRAEGK